MQNFDRTNPSYGRARPHRGHREHPRPGDQSGRSSRTRSAGSPRSHSQHAGRSGLTAPTPVAGAGATTDDLTTGRPSRRFGIRPRFARPQPARVDTIIVSSPPARPRMRVLLLVPRCHGDERAEALTEAAEQAFLARLRTHLGNHALERMTLVLHGGEPMLFGKRRFAGLCAGIRNRAGNRRADLDRHHDERRAGRR